MPSYSYLTHLECGRCGQVYEAETVQTVSACCGKPLLARYDLARARREWDRAALAERPATMWCYHELLPACREEDVVSLGEGMTPLLASTEGIFPGLEGAATVAAYQKLLADGMLRPQDEVVLFVTGSGVLSLDQFPAHAPILRPGEKPW